MKESGQPLMMTVRTGLGTLIYPERTNRHTRAKCKFADEVDTISRVPRFHVGWQSITYKKKRYQLFGGVRTPFFICLNSEIKRK